MIVVLDTNIWLSELALNSTLGAAVRFFLRQRNAQLALPEVVRMEAERNFREKLKKLVENVRDNHRQLLTVFGKLKEVVLPDNAAIENKVAEIFSGVGVELLEVDFSINSAKSSFLKTIEKLPPSDQNQQFKDGVLWADCISLLERDEVFLVTSDTAFFHGRKYEDGLAANLIAETIGQPNQLKVFRSLSELLTDIKTDVTIDESFLVQLFLDRHRSLVDDILQRYDFCLNNSSEIARTLYATEDPRVLYIDFNIDIACADLSDQERTDAVLHLKGCGSYNVDVAEYSDVRITGQELDFLLRDGTKKQLPYSIFAGNVVVGHKDVAHSVRYRLSYESC
jgi:hypothetical protein